MVSILTLEIGAGISSEKYNAHGIVAPSGIVFIVVRKQDIERDAFHSRTWLFIDAITQDSHLNNQSVMHSNEYLNSAHCGSRQIVLHNGIINDS